MFGGQGEAMPIRRQLEETLVLTWCHGFFILVVFVLWVLAGIMIVFGLHFFFFDYLIKTVIHPSTGEGIMLWMFLLAPFFLLFAVGPVLSLGSLYLIGLNTLAFKWIEGEEPEWRESLAIVILKPWGRLGEIGLSFMLWLGLFCLTQLACLPFLLRWKSLHYVFFPLQILFLVIYYLALVHLANEYEEHDIAMDFKAPWASLRDHSGSWMAVLVCLILILTPGIAMLDLDSILKSGVGGQWPGLAALALGVVPAVFLIAVSYYMPQQGPFTNG